MPRSKNRSGGNTGPTVSTHQCEYFRTRSGCSRACCPRASALRRYLKCPSHLGRGQGRVLCQLTSPSSSPKRGRTEINTCQSAKKNSRLAKKNPAASKLPPIASNHGRMYPATLAPPFVPTHWMNVVGRSSATPKHPLARASARQAAAPASSQSAGSTSSSPFL